MSKLYTAAQLIFAVLVLTVFAAGPSAAQVSKQGSLEHPYAPGEVLVKFKADADQGEKAFLSTQLQVRKTHGLLRRWEQWKLGRGWTTEQAMAVLAERDDVEYVEPNYIFKAELESDDPLFPLLWGLKNTGQDGGTSDADIDAELAWNQTTGSSEILVAVIDTGIDYTHPDLVDNIWSNPLGIPCHAADEEIPEEPSDYRGCDFSSNDSDGMDDHLHGTHVAGTIGATGNNARGVVGVNWDVSLVPLKFLNENASGLASEAAKALEYAILIGADVTNNSWGGGPACQTLLDAIEAANDAGILFVAAAGNAGLDNDAIDHYPSNYDVPNVIAVASTTRKDEMARLSNAPYKSNFGATSVDLGAPGVEILSTLPSFIVDCDEQDPACYGFLNGTSMATPHVAGTAALLRAVRPNLSVAALKNLILSNVDPISDLAGKTVTGGRLNANIPEDQVLPAAISDLAVDQTTSNSVYLSWSASGDDGLTGTAFAYDLRYSTTPIDEANFASATAVSGEPTPQPPGSAEQMEIPLPEASTTYFFAIKALDDWENGGPIGNVPSGTTLPPPTFFSWPESFEISARFGRSADEEMIIRNIGVGSLDWAIPPTCETEDPYLADPIAFCYSSFECPPDAETIAPIFPVPCELVTASPVDGRLFGGEHEAVALTFGGPGLPVGTYDDTFTAQSNDPSNSLVEHPFRLKVEPLPRLALGAEVNSQVVLEGETVFLGSCEEPQPSITEHSFPTLWPPLGAGTLELEANGDLCTTDQIAVLTVETDFVGLVSGHFVPNPGVDCLMDCFCENAVFPVDGATLALWSADGAIDAQVAFSANAESCSSGMHAVRLGYNPSFETLRFSPIQVRHATNRSIVLANIGGGDPLEIESISSDNPAFIPFPPSMTIENDEHRTVSVAFLPSTPGLVRGTLSIVSNDPDRRETEITLTAFAGPAGPVLAEPNSLSFPVAQGEKAVDSFSLWNGFPISLAYSVTIDSLGGPDFVTVSPEDGVLERRSGINVGVLADAQDLSPGSYSSDVVISFDNPLALDVTVRVELDVNP